MKIILSLALLVGLAAQAQTKPWHPGMCKVQQEHASKAYVIYCMKASPDAYPKCLAAAHDPREAMWASQAGGGHGAYFEVLDCSWHSGANPREEKTTKHPKKAKP